MTTRDVLKKQFVRVAIGFCAGVTVALLALWKWESVPLAVVSIVVILSVSSAAYHGMKCPNCRRSVFPKFASRANLLAGRSPERCHNCGCSFDVPIPHPPSL
jgi:hypothetical protein